MALSYLFTKLSAFVAAMTCMFYNIASAQELMVGAKSDALRNAYQGFNLSSENTDIVGYWGGDNELGIYPVVDIVQVAPSLGFLISAYSVLDAKHLAKIHKDGALFDLLDSELSDFDLKVLGLQYLGSHAVVAKEGRLGDGPLKFEDLRGQIIGVSLDQDEMLITRNMGLMPVPLPLEKQLQALDLGVVEILETSLESFEATTCYDLVHTQHRLTLGLILVKQSWWQKLDHEQRRSMADRILLAREATTQNILDQEANAIEAHKAMGCRVVATDSVSLKDGVRNLISTSGQSVRWKQDAYETLKALGG